MEFLKKLSNKKNTDICLIPLKKKSLNAPSINTKWHLKRNISKILYYDYFESANMDHRGRRLRKRHRFFQAKKSMLSLWSLPRWSIFVDSIIIKWMITIFSKKIITYNTHILMLILKCNTCNVRFYFEESVRFDTQVFYIFL